MKYNQSTNPYKPGTEAYDWHNAGGPASGPFPRQAAPAPAPAADTAPSGPKFAEVSEEEMSNRRIKGLRDSGIPVPEGTTSMTQEEFLAARAPHEMRGIDPLRGARTLSVGTEPVVVRGASYPMAAPPQGRQTTRGSNTRGHSLAAQAAYLGLTGHIDRMARIDETLAGRRDEAAVKGMIGGEDIPHGPGGAIVAYPPGKPHTFTPGAGAETPGLGTFWMPSKEVIGERAKDPIEGTSILERGAGTLAGNAPSRGSVAKGIPFEHGSPIYQGHSFTSGELGRLGESPLGIPDPKSKARAYGRPSSLDIRQQYRMMATPGGLAGSRTRGDVGDFWNMSTGEGKPDPAAGQRYADALAVHEMYAESAGQTAEVDTERPVGKLIDRGSGATSGPVTSRTVSPDAIDEMIATRDTPKPSGTSSREQELLASGRAAQEAAVKNDITKRKWAVARAAKEGTDPDAGLNQLRADGKNRPEDDEEETSAKKPKKSTSRSGSSTSSNRGKKPKAKSTTPIRSSNAANKKTKAE